jgi:transposase InsO family protein
LGFSREAYYKAVKRQKNSAFDNQIILNIVCREKALLKNCGSKKIYHILKPEIKKTGIKTGRDKLHKSLKKNNLLLKRKKYKKPKTASKHHFYKHKNLIKNLEINQVNQVWVSDITYIRVNGHWNYLTLITNLFSRRIVGYSFSKGMSVLETTQPVLNMALKTRSKKQKTILHSDRGLQYFSPSFTKQFKKYKAHRFYV